MSKLRRPILKLPRKTAPAKSEVLPPADSDYVELTERGAPDFTAADLADGNGPAKFEDFFSDLVRH